MVELAGAAVDPREIAAQLEVTGVSDRVARDDYGRASVFVIADELWRSTPFAPLEVRAGRVSLVPGGPTDLVRGLVYGAPALLLFALQRASTWPMTPLLLALAVTWGWGLGQVTANLAYELRGRCDTVGELAVLSRLLMLTPPTTLLVVAVPTWWSHTGLGAGIAAMCLATFMVASAILVLRDRLTLAVACLVPALVVSAVEVTHPSLEPSLVVGAVAVSSGATVLSAWSLVRERMPQGMAFTTELRRVVRHFVHGLVCGAALAAVVFASSGLVHRSGVRGVVSVPIVLSLGVMEWQLRSFRAGASSALALHRLEHFEQLTWHLFRRSLGRYLAVVFGISVVLAVAVGSFHRPRELAVFALTMLLGPIYLTDLTLVSVSRVDIALRGWMRGMAVGVAAGLFALLAGVASSMAGVVAVASGLTVCALSLGVAVRPAVVAAVNHY
jgi:hypothetical protein